MTGTRTFKTESGLRAYLDGAGAGLALHVLVMHDTGCAPSRCACKPWYRVQPLSAAATQEGARMEQEWLKATGS